MVDDISRKLGDALKKMQRQITRLQSARWLENASVRSGRLRFIGGILRLDSGALLELIGQWRFFGNGAITGDVVAEGRWTQNGSWEFNGPGEIAGDVALTGDFDLTGVFKSGNVRIEDGKIYVGAAGGEIVIDGATGAITVPGSQPIVLRQVGGLARIDLGGTAQIWSGGDGVTILGVGGGFVNVYSDGVDIGGAGKVTRISNQVRLTNVQPAPGGVVTVPLLIDPSTGVVYR